MLSQDMISNDMKVAEGIAKYLAPMDTGNLRYNAISSELTNDGFRIKYSLTKAFYIYFLEEGTSKSTEHQHFIANDTLPMIASFVNAKHKSRNKSAINHFKYYSQLGLTDMKGNVEARQARLEQSLKTDVDIMAEKNKWEHTGENVRYDANFESRRIR